MDMHFKCSESAVTALINRCNREFSINRLSGERGYEMILNKGDEVKQIDIVVPFTGAAQLAELWAEDEQQIDFYNGHDEAARCTTAFAAIELKRCLSHTLPSAVCRIVEQQPDAGCFVSLRIEDRVQAGEAFTMEGVGEGVIITGKGRAGVLYGAYELLRMQGWRWYAPGNSGEIAPQPGSRLVMPAAKLLCQASMDLGRGFDFEYKSMESASFFLWMARNRLNIATYRFETAAFCRKLGMSFKVGGHIFEQLLDPDRPLPGGSTVWDSHPEWYGMPENGIRTKESALRIQFCVSQPDLIDFLGAELVLRLQGVWQHADRVDLWGFDTWGHSCMCANCQRIGNSADRLLYFVSGVRDIINRALAEGALSHDVKLIVCGYEGTDTLTGPVRPVPENVTAAGDLIVYYPINRCYEHGFADANCSTNARYHEALQSWCNHKESLPVIIGEYYNVSKFEDLPLLFTTRLAQDLPSYYRMGTRGMTYMHVPLVNWGMRTLTQLMYAQLSWDVNTDVAAFVREYHANWYGPHAERMSSAYEKIEQAWLLIADWRSWKKDSILSLLLAWDGAQPVQPLAPGDHFQHQAVVAIQSGHRSLGLFEQAAELIEQALAADKSAAAQQRPAQWKVALNPVEARRQALDGLRYELRLGEDRRLLRYGVDTLRLLVAFVTYYNALYKKDAAQADISWQTIEQTAERMDSYFLPLGYEQPGAGFESKDALTRTQLRELIRRCRSGRADATIIRETTGLNKESEVL
ncbi:DUF4838 domain-containing protein [Paenibacillaceae bacterium]|nr:DUF4838 domain-containing protein [Paenibacillaceae bacterium]